MTGLSEIMANNGFVVTKRSSTDTTSNFLTDLIKQVDPQNAAQFVKDFEAATGVSLSGLGGKGAEEIANHLARKIRASAQQMNAVSQIARRNGVTVPQQKQNGISVRQLAQSQIATPLGLKMSDIDPNSRAAKFGRGMARFQGNTIRAIVSNMGTTALNATGYVALSTVKQLSDLFMSTVFLGQAGLEALAKNPEGLAANLNSAAAPWQAFGQRMRNLVDPDLTYDTYRSIINNDPDGFAELSNTINGGVDNLDAIAHKYGFSPESNMFDKAQEKWLEWMSTVNLVQAQDVWSKSQELMYQLDLYTRHQFGESLADIMARPGAGEFLRSPQFAEVKLKAAYETGRAISSTSFKGRTGLSEIAGAIEDFRKLPVVGITIPFGRFFNNVVATSADLSGVSLAYKHLAGGHTNRSSAELTAYTGIGIGMVYSLYESEVEELDRGTGWAESTNNLGSLTDKTFLYPVILPKAVARLVAHAQRGTRPSDEEARQMLDMVDRYEDEKRRGGTAEISSELLGEMSKAAYGQLFRQFSESMDGMATIITNLLSEEGNDGERWPAAAELGGALGAQFVSGWTRGLEPVNQVVAFANGTDLTVMDRKEGHKVINSAIRYMDQIMLATVGEDGYKLITGQEYPSQDYKAASGSVEMTPGKFLGQRNGGRSTNVEMVMNHMGLATWRLDKITDAPEADNRYARLFNVNLEQRARELWQDPRFKLATREEQVHRWKQTVKSTRDYTLKAMEQSAGDDRRYAKLIRMSSVDRRLMRQGLAELADRGGWAQGLEFDELNLQQLELLERYVKSRPAFLDRRR